MRFDLRSFGDGTRTPAQDLTRLHMELFGPGSVWGLSRNLVERFYYGCLPESGLLFGSVAYLDDVAIGFAAATLRPASFLADGLSRHWGQAARALLREPLLALSMWPKLRAMREASTLEPAAGAPAQLLAIGVLPDYRSRRFKQRLGVSPSTELLRAVTDRFVAQGVSRAVLYVERGNLDAHRFYAREGWQPERIVAAGSSTSQLEFGWSATAREPLRSRLARERASLDKLIGITLADVGLGYPHTIEGFTENSHDGLRGFVLKNPVG